MRREGERERERERDRGKREDEERTKFGKEATFAHGTDQSPWLPSFRGSADVALISVAPS